MSCVRLDLLLKVVILEVLAVQSDEGAAVLPVLDYFDHAFGHVFDTLDALVVILSEIRGVVLGFAELRDSPPQRSVHGLGADAVYLNPMTVKVEVRAE